MYACTALLLQVPCIPVCAAPFSHRAQAARIPVRDGSSALHEIQRAARSATARMAATDSANNAVLQATLEKQHGSN
jgi:hypothetical protein